MAASYTHPALRSTNLRKGEMNGNVARVSIA